MKLFAVALTLRAFSVGLRKSAVHHLSCDQTSLETLCGIKHTEPIVLARVTDPATPLCFACRKVIEVSKFVIHRDDDSADLVLSNRQVEMEFSFAHE